MDDAKSELDKEIEMRKALGSDRAFFEDIIKKNPDLFSKDPWYLDHYNESKDFAYIIKNLDNITPASLQKLDELTGGMVKLYFENTPKNEWDKHQILYKLQNSENLLAFLDLYGQPGMKEGIEKNNITDFNEMRTYILNPGAWAADVKRKQNPLPAYPAADDKNNFRWDRPAEITPQLRTQIDEALGRGEGIRAPLPMLKALGWTRVGASKTNLHSNIFIYFVKNDVIGVHYIGGGEIGMKSDFTLMRSWPRLNQGLFLSAYELGFTKEEILDNTHPSLKSKVAELLENNDQMKMKKKNWLLKYLG